MKPYCLPNHVSKALACDQTANYLIMQWLETQHHKKQGLLLKESYNPKYIYVPDRKLRFTAIGNGLFTNSANVKFWINLEYPTTKVNRQVNVHSLLGSKKVFESSKSHRLQVGKTLGLNGYVTMTSNLTLYSPRTVFFLFLTANTDNASAFRKFMQLSYPIKPLSTRKLSQNVFQIYK